MALNSLAWLDKARDSIGWEIAAVVLDIATPAMICGLPRLATRTIAGAHARGTRPPFASGSLICES
jgi:hypothetical protein